MKKELEQYEKGTRHFKAIVGTITLDTNHFGLSEEKLSLKKVSFANFRSLPIADHIYIGKTQATEPLFDIARQGLTNQEVSFYGRILEYNEGVQIYDGLNSLREDVHCKIGYIKDVTIHFK
jgi:hypothetical protein